VCSVPVLPYCPNRLEIEPDVNKTIRQHRHH
jgi:hypothetical protein